jgi:XTP/dITP diphosphohydrolase
MKLLYATTNAGKLTEAQQILHDVEILSLNDFPQLVDMDVEETGATFIENARIKAIAYGDIAGVLTVAEDAGLVIDALDGKPGVYSARFAPTDAERNQKVLDLLKDEKHRTARFVSALCLYNPVTKEEHVVEGTCEGAIAEERKGGGGFGYDPIFVPDGYDKTFSELEIDIKNTLSHRAMAIEKLRQIID